MLHPLRLPYPILPQDSAALSTLWLNGTRTNAWFNGTYYNFEKKYNPSANSNFVINVPYLLYICKGFGIHKKESKIKELCLRVSQEDNYNVLL